MLLATLDGCATTKVKRNVFVNNMPLTEAQALWLERLSAEGCLAPMEPEEIMVDEALGRITAEPVYAPSSSPFYNASAMDGIAVRFLDTVGANETKPIILNEGAQFVYVNTGNAIPAEFDAVIMIEDVQPRGEGKVEIISAVTPWQHVRTIGEDIVTTELIVPSGHTIRPIDQGALLATGVLNVKVRPVPRVLVVPTGSELVQPGEPTEPGNIIEFNSRILAGYLTEWGVHAVRHGITKDKPESLKETILNGVAHHDMVVINAGASAGSKDFTVDVLREIGEVVVHGVNIKPGKPVILAIVQGKPVIGLPGYPVSAVITLRLFVRKLISMMLGQEEEPVQYATAKMSRPLSSRMGVDDFVRVKLGRVGGNLMATPTGRGAGAVMSLVQADGILTVPSGSEGIGVGESVQVELLRESREVENTLVFIGSHDNVLDVLANMLHRREAGCRLSSAHVGSMGGILAIKRGEAHVAGTHLLDEASGEYNVPFIKKHLADMPLMLVNLAHRGQGLLVPKGNPKNIKGFEDLTREDVKFINRQRGAGTRLLADMHLNRLGIDPEAVNGYDREEYTHMNVASAVACGTADTGLAIMAASEALHLDFVPVAKERYDLIIPMAYAQDEKIVSLLELLRENKEFRRTVQDLGGYDLLECGRILYMQK